MEWKFMKERKNEKGTVEKRMTVRAALKMVMENVDIDDRRPLIPLMSGDPSPFPSFQISSVAVDAVVDALRSARFNTYSPVAGLLSARKAISDHISSDLPYKLSPDDVYLTAGCKQAIQAIVCALSHAGANILLPKPGYARYDMAATSSGIEARFYDLLPNKNWEVDLDQVETLVDDNTIAMVIINPGNPCGNIFTHEHLEKVAETARKHGLLIIADEVDEHLAFGNKPFVRMGVFASKVPIVTLGSLSKRWMVPGWRLGWLVTTDPNGILQKSEIMEQVKAFLDVAGEPATFIQAAVPKIIETQGDFFSRTTQVLRQDADIIFNKLKEIACITCPNKPEGSMFVLVKLDMTLLEGIQDDIEFSVKLAMQEKVIVLPGSTIGMTNWIRITFSLEPSTLEEGLQRIKIFCQRNAKKL